MTVPNRMALQCFTLLALAGFLLTQVGCNISLEQDPEKTVSVEISGVKASERETITETLEGMVDGSGGHSMFSSFAGESMSVSLSPVSDPEAFAKKINFGKVTEVKERTIKVDCTQ